MYVKLMKIKDNIYLGFLICSACFQTLNYRRIKITMMSKSKKFFLKKKKSNPSFQKEI